MDRRSFLALGAGAAVAGTAGCLSREYATPDQDADAAAATTTDGEGQETFLSETGVTACDGTGYTLLSEYYPIETPHDVYSIPASAAVAQGEDATLTDLRLDLVARDGTEWTIAQGPSPSAPARAYNHIDATRSLHVTLEGREVGLRAALSTESGDPVDMTWSLVIFGGE